MNIKSKLASALLATLLLAACGGGMSGTYKGAIGSLTFDGSKAHLDAGMTTMTMDYSVDGDTILLHEPKVGGVEASIKLTRNADGSLTTPWGRMKPQQ